MKKKINIVVSKAFPTIHKRSGEPTDFAKKIVNGDKIHTIRKNYDLWAVNADKMQSGKFIMSLRQWTDKPRRSKQREVYHTEEPIGVERIFMLYTAENDSISVDIENRYLSDDDITQLAANDGLTVEDFKEWFFARHRHKEDAKFYGVIIHFTPFRYAHAR